MSNTPYLDAYIEKLAEDQGPPTPGKQTQKLQAKLTAGKLGDRAKSIDSFQKVVSQGDAYTKGRNQAKGMGGAKDIAQRMGKKATTNTPFLDSWTRKVAQDPLPAVIPKGGGETKTTSAEPKKVVKKKKAPAKKPLLDLDQGGDFFGALGS